MVTWSECPLVEGLREWTGAVAFGKRNRPFFWVTGRRKGPGLGSLSDCLRQFHEAFQRPGCSCDTAELDTAPHCITHKSACTAMQRRLSVGSCTTFSADERRCRARWVRCCAQHLLTWAHAHAWRIEPHRICHPVLLRMSSTKNLPVLLKAAADV